MADEDFFTLPLGEEPSDSGASSTDEFVGWRYGISCGAHRERVFDWRICGLEELYITRRTRSGAGAHSHAEGAPSCATRSGSNAPTTYVSSSKTAIKPLSVYSN